MKGPLSRSVRYFREGIKAFGSRAAAQLGRQRSFQFFGVPAGLASGLEDGDKTVYYLAERLPMHLPLSVEEKHFWQMRAFAEEGASFAEAGVLTLPNAVATHKGGNLASDGKLVTTFLQPIDGKPPHQDELFRFSTKRFFPRLYHAQTPVVTLSTCWQGAFYHWVYESLPRLHLATLAGYGDSPLYAPTHFPFQKETLSLLISPERVIDADFYQGVFSPLLIAPSIPTVPAPWVCSFLREAFLPKFSKKPPLRLYVSRNDASRRRILNEEEVFQTLKKYGFQKLELSHYPFKEQAELFYAAEAVVAPHGAGLSHLVFCTPGTPVLEMFSPAYYNACYWHVCNRVGLPYYYLLGEGQSYETTTNLDPDFVVDLNKLNASLKLMLTDRPHAHCSHR